MAEGITKDMKSFVDGARDVTSQTHLQQGHETASLIVTPKSGADVNIIMKSGEAALKAEGVEINGLRTRTVYIKEGEKGIEVKSLAVLASELKGNGVDVDKLGEDQKNAFIAVQAEKNGFIEKAKQIVFDLKPLKDMAQVPPKDKGGVLLDTAANAQGVYDAMTQKLHPDGKAKEPNAVDVKTHSAPLTTPIIKSAGKQAAQH